MNEIEDEICKLEHSETNWPNCEKLSRLYVVREYFKKEPSRSEPQKVAENQEDKRAAVGQVWGSEFLETCSGVDVEELLFVLDEHMEMMLALFPREYDALMAKIKELPKNHNKK